MDEPRLKRRQAVRQNLQLPRTRSAFSGVSDTALPPRPGDTFIKQATVSPPAKATPVQATDRAVY